jgi:hypothetical protein
MMTTFSVFMVRQTKEIHILTPPTKPAIAGWRFPRAHGKYRIEMAVSPIEVRAQRLLAALGGIVSARAVADEQGRLAEIHILASPEYHPKQIVRNIESALSAGLGVIVDRRIISVAQLRNDANTPFVNKPKAPPARRPSEPKRLRRVVYVQYDARATAPLDSHCRVVLLRGDDELTGTATGVNTPQGRADAAARAVIEALQSGGGMKGVGLEGTALVQANGKTYVLVSARMVNGRHTRTLTGIAMLGRSPEEAAIFAALQATNRIGES